MYIYIYIYLYIYIYTIYSVTQKVPKSYRVFPTGGMGGVPSPAKTLLIPPAPGKIPPPPNFCSLPPKITPSPPH